MFHPKFLERSKLEKRPRPDDVTPVSRWRFPYVRATLTKLKKDESAFGNTERKDTPKPNHNCADKETPNDNEPCPETPVRKEILVFVRTRGDHLNKGFDTPAFLARFFFNGGHQKGEKGNDEPESESGP
jgi:hypothetical protein